MSASAVVLQLRNIKNLPVPYNRSSQGCSAVEHMVETDFIAQDLLEKMASLGGTIMITVVTQMAPT